MVDLVTLEQVNLALRLDLTQSGSPLEFTDERTPDIELKIAQAQSAVLRHLKSQADDDWTAETAPPEVTAAIILGVKSLLDEEKSDMLARLATGVPGPDNPIGALLYPLRDPAIA
ncbi:hypothetical protein [Brevundimonas sp.]|uniref:hypothetical protein n=1 Tax=Brevundimonas sp. TaxID=1871086 RepID=UPI002D48943A|nr:hypothetical protein [Brevundimonas sp.]HYC66648.1 hypothetical protein [Brevundimonas sp.]